MSSTASDIVIQHRGCYEIVDHFCHGLGHEFSTYSRLLCEIVARTKPQKRPVAYARILISISVMIQSFVIECCAFENGEVGSIVRCARTILSFLQGVILNLEPSISSFAFSVIGTDTAFVMYNSFIVKLANILEMLTYCLKQTLDVRARYILTFSGTVP